MTQPRRRFPAPQWLLAAYSIPPASYRLATPRSAAMSPADDRDTPSKTETSRPTRSRLPECLGRLLLLFGLVLPGALSAHPHAWIDLRVDLIVNDRGELVRMEQSWNIDPTYSHVLLEELTRDLGGDIAIDAALEHAAERMLANLAAYDYFTVIEVDNRSLATPQARNGHLDLEGRRLQLRFELSFEGQGIQAGDGFRYRVYDPEYWIEILHDPDDVVFVENRRGCEVRISDPRPDAQMVIYAASLDRQDRSPGEDLGRHFAETASLECD